MGAVPTGVEAELAAVFRDQRSRLWGYLMRGLGQAETAEDMLQETFLRAWDHRESLRGSGGVEATRRFLWRIARNLMIDEIRVRTRRRGREREIGDPPANPGAAGEIEHADCLRVVREAAKTLPNPRARQCMQLWLEGRTLTEISTELGLALGQVRGLLQRGKAEVVQRAGDRLTSRGKERPS